MSMADDQVKSQRTIAERAGVRWPSMARRTVCWILRLPTWVAGAEGDADLP